MATARSQLRVIGDDEADALRDAMELAGKFLGRRARSEAEVRDKLTAAETSPGVIDQAIDRLYALALLDDRAFALEYIEERVRRRGMGARALISELKTKGVSREDAEVALAEAGLDEVAVAVELASRFVRKVAHRPPREQAPRMMAMLARRGIDHESAAEAVAAVLPPEGWD